MSRTTPVMAPKDGRRGCARGLFALAFALSALVPASAAVPPQAIYGDALQNGWQDWSWAAHDLAGTTFVHGGAKAISFVPAGWQAVYLHRDDGISGADYDGLEFWINGGTESHQDIRIVFVLGGSVLSDRPLTDYLASGPRANTWDFVRVPLDAAGVGSRDFDGIYWQDGTGGAQPALWLDDIVLTPRAGGGGTGATVAISVDPNADRRPISPLIYGVNFGDAPPRYPVRRWGGNAVTRYNWRVDAGNKAFDWFFMNIADDTDVARLPDGSSADRFIDDARADGAEPLLTVPLIGWTPRDRVKRWGFSVARHGAQQKTECTETGGAFWCEPDAGNGVTPDGTNVTGNDPLDTSTAIGPSFVTDWMDHIAGRVGRAGGGGPRFFALDNEPMLWNSTHRDVHPAPVDYAEIWQRTRDHASAMKASDPDAQTFGPVVWGWCAYFYSAKDGCAPGVDYAAMGPFLEWYLQQVAQYRAQHGVRLVDWLDVHYYPQAGGVALSDDESTATSALRLRSVKSLYDPGYVDESWIGTPVRLIPRMKDILARKAAPGTKFALTEYNWGGDAGLSSALAQVEVLGILGREGVDLATRWVAPEAGSRVEEAFEVYLDYDGAGSKVEGDSVRAVSADVDAVGAYAVRRADGRLYLVLINKAVSPRTAVVTVAGGVDGILETWSFDGASRWGARPFLTPTETGGFVLDMPARSAWLVVGQAAPCAVPAAVAALRVAKAAGTTLHLTWSNVAGAEDYVVREDASPAGSFGTITGTATDGTAGLTIPVPVGNRFYLLTARDGCGESALR